MTLRAAPDPPDRAELVVVGAGVVGAATAWQAAKADIEAVVVEGLPAACSATTAVATGGFRLQLDTHEDFLLARESVECFRELERAPEASGAPFALKEAGYLWVTTEAERAERQRELVAVQRGWGLTDVELLAGDDARARFPYTLEERRPGALPATRRLSGHPPTDRGAPRSGASKRCARDRGDRNPCANKRLTAVRTSRGDIATSHAVIAAGPLSGDLAAACGVRLKITTVRRQKIVMPDVPEVPLDAPMTIDEDTGAHWRPAFRGAWLLYPDPKEPPRRPERTVCGDSDFAFQLLDPASDVSVARVTPFWADVWDRTRATGLSRPASTR